MRIIVVFFGILKYLFYWFARYMSSTILLTSPLGFL